jgi:signal transduction histidine kinase/DNA-binding NarL/FixJ family response regulator
VRYAGFASIGNKTTDSDKEKLQQEFLIYMGLLMSGGGIVWGAICTYFDLLLPSMIPYGYTVITLLNFTYFYFSKNFGAVRFIQVLISLLLPFFFQWSLGGFIPSGAVMLWSMIALLGSLTFQDTRLSLKWLVTYLLLTIGSGIIDGDVKEYGTPISPEVNTLLFVVNFVVISMVVFGLIVHLTTKQEDQNQALEKTLDLLREAQSQLEGQNVELAQEKEKADQARSAAEVANRAKSTFLANMSHEIRTPLNAILGYAQILDGDSELNESQRKAIGTIGNSGNHLLKLIHEVLDLSKIEAGQMELQKNDFDLAHLLDSMNTMFEMRCREKQLRWQLTGLDASIQLVIGDESKLMQVFNNLLNNAVKFTDAGEVVFEMEILEDDRYRFTVSDTGLGISAADQETIFRVFEQGEAGLQKGGSGLGLAISQRILALMDSQLELESTAGAGTRFSFTLHLPAVNKDSASDDGGQWARVERVAKGVQVRAGVHLHALVVDDIEENRQILSQFLEVVGIEVEVAVNGREALEAVERRVPDLVLMDIRMPEMDGMEAMRQLQQREDSAMFKVAAVSASTFEHERQEYLAAGFDAFIGKPVQMDELYRGIAELLDIEFEFKEWSDSEAVEAAPDPTQVNLPAELHASLVSAADLAQVTVLEQQLEGMEQLGPMAARLAQQLRQLSQDFQFDEIASLLEQVNVES